MPIRKRIGRIDKSKTEKTGKPGKRVLVKKLQKRKGRVEADPEFLAFFAGDFQEQLDSVEIPGMHEPSWDRKAAYLLYKATR